LYGTVIRLVRNSEKSIDDHNRYHKWSLDQQETRKQMQRRRFRFLQGQVSKINEKEPDRTPWKSKQRAKEPGIIGSGVPRHDDVMAFRLSEIEASFPLRHQRGMLGHLEL
jgi:hypothetical protein